MPQRNVHRFRLKLKTMLKHIGMVWIYVRRGAVWSTQKRLLFIPLSLISPLKSHIIGAFSSNRTYTPW